MENKDNEQPPALRRSARIPKIQQQAAARAAAQAEAEAEAEAETARQPKRRRTNAPAKAASATAPRTATKRATSGPSRRRGRQQPVNGPVGQRQLAPRPEHQPGNPVYQPAIQPAVEAVPQPQHQQLAFSQQQFQGQYQGQYKQETWYAPQAHYQQQVPQQQQATYHHQAGYPREIYRYGPGYQYQPTYPPLSQAANPPATQAVIPAPVHTDMDHYSQPQPEYHTGYETVQQHSLPTINQLRPPTGHAVYQTTQQQPLPSVHQLIHPGFDATDYDQTGVQLAPLQQAPQPPAQPAPAPAGLDTHQNAQQPVQQPVAQPAHQPPPQPVAQAAEEPAGQPTEQAERQLTVSGFTGLQWSNYNMPNGGNNLMPEKQSEVPTGWPIDRWTRDGLYDHRAAEYLNKWHCCFDDKSMKPDNDESTGPADDEKDFCLRLLKSKFPTPSGTLFDPGDFEYVYERAKSMNEMEILHLIGDLIVPQAEMAVHRDQVTWTKALKDKLCQPWTHSVPFDEQSTRLSQRFVRNMESTGYLLPIPQPDRTVGFFQLAFSARQQRRLMAQTINDVRKDPVSLFYGPRNMFFPFLTAEVQCGSSFEPAERENAHNMAVAMKGIVALFKRVSNPEEEEDPNQEDLELNQKVLELNRKVLGFSISLNSERVKIHAHYPIIEEEKITYHRWCVRDFKWTSEADKWQAYKFVMAVYNDWAPRHLKRLHSAIDGLPLEYQIDMSPNRSD